MVTPTVPAVFYLNYTLEEDPSTGILISIKNNLITLTLSHIFIVEVFQNMTTCVTLAWMFLATEGLDEMLKNVRI